MTITTELPEDHVTRRNRDYRRPRNRMIGRLTADEFDIVDAIVTNMRAGHAPTRRALSLTLAAEPESVDRRMFNARAIGLVETEQIDEFTTATGTLAPVWAYVPSVTARRLFNEALALMDRGEVAA